MRERPTGAFTVEAEAGQARAGVLVTRHGSVSTPAFVPCATHGSLRGVALGSLTNELLLANIYHLALRPGTDTIERLGGLHRFMGWDRAIVTDSGGFQAFALPKYVRFSPQGIQFRSHIDGSTHEFTPERVVEMQERVGVDIATCLDVCTGFPIGELAVAGAVGQTTEWGKRSVDRWRDREMLLYGMVQGSIYPRQRERAVRDLTTLPFSGFAIGGNMYTFGQSIATLAAEKPRMWQVVAFTCSLLPTNKPRHLLGVGEPRDLIEGVRAGVDTFDCVMATRIARHGSAWVRRDRLTWAFDRVDLANARWTHDQQPLDPLCDCPLCVGPYQRGYLRHLVKLNDPVVLGLLSLHNVAQLNRLTAVLRAAIIDGSFEMTFPQRGNVGSGTM